MRLDRLISTQASLSRARAKALIRRKAVRVNGHTALKSSMLISPEDEVDLYGEYLAYPQERYILMHKPAGYICSSLDEEYPSALNLLSTPTARGNPISRATFAELHFAGRLDVDTTGVLLLTDDGGWSHRITSPKRRCEKVYRVRLAERPHIGQLGVLRAGVQLRGETGLTAALKVVQIGELEIELTITEGKYHQVKRMVAAAGNHVDALHRVRIGPFSCESLSPGEWRHLDAVEIASI